MTALSKLQRKGDARFYAFARVAGAAIRGSMFEVVTCIGDALNATKSQQAGDLVALERSAGSGRIVLDSNGGLDDEK